MGKKTIILLFLSIYCGIQAQEPFVLITSLYNETHPQRLAEYKECLDRNSAHKTIGTIHVLYDTSKDSEHNELYDYICNNKAIKITHIEGRPAYDYCFQLANELYPNKRVILTNGDIYFNDTLFLLDDYDLANKFLALTRWNVSPLGNLMLYYWPNNIPAIGSQDAWIFQTPMKKICDPSICLGVPHCDIKIAYQAYVRGLEVCNPCLSIQCCHLHKSGVHTYTGLPFPRDGQILQVKWTQVGQPGIILAHDTKPPTGFGLDFDTAMSLTDHYNQDLAHKDPYWNRARELYNQHIVNNQLKNSGNSIPKIIHQIWLGSPLPLAQRKLQKTVLEKHPDWQYILWDDAAIEKFDLVNKKAYYATNNYGKRSDIARYEILYRLGGVYFDTDFDVLYAFDALNQLCDFYAGLGHGPSFHVYNGLIGARPGHPLLKICIDDIAAAASMERDDFIGVLFDTGPFFFDKCIKKYIPTCTDRCVFLPATYFYPWPHFHRDENLPEQVKKWIQPQTFAVHYWHTAWNGGVAKSKKQRK